jgi:hypothetical protein
MAFSHFSVAILVHLLSAPFLNLIAFPDPDRQQKLGTASRAGLGGGWVSHFATSGPCCSLYHSMIYLFTAAYGVSFGPVAWILPTEVFPLSLRSKGAAISTASNWFNNCKLWPELLVPKLTSCSHYWFDHTTAGALLACVRRHLIVLRMLSDHVFEV